MSFIDGIVSGVKNVLGIDSGPEPKPKDPAPKRAQNLAADTPTKFERTTPATGRADQGSASSFDLGAQIRAAAPAASAAATTGADSVRGGGLPPHLSADRATMPDSGPRGAATGARAAIYDRSSGAYHGTVDNLATGTDDASVAARNVQRGLDYYAQAFGRDGLDGAGSGVNVLINDRSVGPDGLETHRGNGGYYATPQADGSEIEAIHFGVGDRYQGARGLVDQRGMQHADDLTIHEVTHGVIRKETGHIGGGADEAGATNEGVADVMAAAATRDWRLGEGQFTEQSDYRVMRNIANPDDPTAIHGLFTTMAEVRAEEQRTGEAEEHWASGVISTAGYRVQQRIGGEAGWQAVERVFYDSIDNNRMGDMSFASTAAALRASAAAVYGEGSTVALVVDEELRRAGL